MKLLPEDERSQFVINIGLDPCLVLYPLRVWEAELKKIYSLNQFVARNRTFARRFQNGATPVEVDGQNRILIPRRLAVEAAIEKDILLFGSFDRIEIWSQERYDDWLAQQTEDPAVLADQIMNAHSEDGGS